MFDIQSQGNLSTMSSCLSGGGRTAYVLDLDIIKSSTSSFRTSHSSSPSSTISESSNSPITISTRKPRTPRKRPNQTYNEAAALLSTAYPNIFSTHDISKPCKFIKPHDYSSFSFEDSSDELLLPFPVEKPIFQIDTSAYEKPYSIDGEEIGCQTNSSNLCNNSEDFDTESILDEEIGEGVIDSIMGDLSGCPKEETITCSNGVGTCVNFCYGYPLGFGLGGRFDFGYGMMRGAFRQNDGGDWWRYPTVDMGEISPRFKVSLSAQKKKKKVENSNPKPPSSTSSKENSVPSKSSLATSNENRNQSKSSSTTSKENPIPITKSSRTEMLLKLNYDEVLNAWSDRGSPFSQDTPGPEFSGSDALARLAHIDLFGESGAMREASVQRYKEKRRTRLFSKKIRYQVRKVNAEQRPRMKGRFVRRSNSSGNGER